jgi:hypothetical protein
MRERGERGERVRKREKNRRGRDRKGVNSGSKKEREKGMMKTKGDRR